MERRKSWFAALGEDNAPKGNAYYCCEDYFDLPKESINWMRFKLMKGIPLRMRDDVGPYRNLPNSCTSAAVTPTDVLKKHANEDSTSSPNKKRKIIDHTRVVAGCSTIETLSSENMSTPTSSLNQSSSSLTSITNVSEDENLNQMEYENLLENRKDTTMTLIQNNSRFYLGLDYTVITVGGLCNLQDPLTR
ncbi:hypothetical protein NQ315_011034 [Exocentrus adspersus]|uniref:THAP-type domain-containing protein n=1 Tax=Exocentrus adspersus TaxID=1586481 RepID=A0AAV8VEV6_9CUCU|nr:hypothetical protein NQ315_011034 [Exocentrus adspersus]